MALLQEVLDRPLDPGYESAAADRREQGLPMSTGWRSPLLVLTAVVLGLVLSVSALTLRTPDPQGADARAELVQRIEAINVAGDASGAQLEQLRADIAGLEEMALRSAPVDRSGELRTAADRVGATALSGPGVVVTLDDAPRDGLEAEDGSTADRVLARDLQLLTNGLWASGAEAIAINDQRLTSTAAIRFAGEAIIVDFRGLTRPYVVRAIGDPEALETEMTTGTTGAYFEDLGADYGIIVDVATEEEVTVPVAERLSTRVSTVVPDEPDVEEDP